MIGKKVFLGGTCNGSTWREELIDMLDVDYFNPVVDDWNEEAQKEELLQRKKCDFVLYTLTPKMTGFYSVSEVTDDSNKRPHKTLLCILEDDGGKTFDEFQVKSLNMVSKLVESNGAQTFKNLIDVANFLNNIDKKW